MGRSRVTALLAPMLLSAGLGRASVINVGPGDDYTKIEAAGPGDTVLIAPGTYQFRVYLSNLGTANEPITIEAADPDNPPVWDLNGQLVEDWPGSYTGGDNGRGCWQVGGGTYYVIDSIVFQNCHTASQNAAGLRYNAADHLTLRNVVMRDNEMGLTGDGTNVLVEFSELAFNGQPANTSEETHNLYIYGGSFTIRWSYLHDATVGQNFHLRCVQCLVESNWIARAANYEGDLMPTGDGPPTFQQLVLLGNVIVPSASPINHSQIVAPYNDTGATGLSFEVDMLWNTVVGNGSGATLLQFNNAGLVASSSLFSNNVVTGLTSVIGATASSTLSVSGNDNWLTSGAVGTNGLAGSIFGTSAALDPTTLRPLTGSPLIGAADVTATPAPASEYYLDEAMPRMYRSRLGVADIGAFEASTTGPGIGPEGPGDGGEVEDAGVPGRDAGGDGGVPMNDAGPPDAGALGAGATDAGDGGAPADGGGSAAGPNGCGCLAHGGPAAPPLIVALLLLGLTRRRSKRLARGACRPRALGDE